MENKQEVPDVRVGQVYEDYEPLYTDSHGKPTSVRRELRVVELAVKSSWRWDPNAGRRAKVDDAVAVMEVLRDADGKVPEKPRKVKVRIDRMLPKKGGYVLVSR